MSLFRAAAGRLAFVLAAATVATWAVQVAADAQLVAPAATAFVLDRDGSFITQIGHETLRPGGGRQVEYGFWPVDPPPRVVAATLALEDRRFFSHPGIDPMAVVRATWHHLVGGRASGASTLAMQVARMQHPRPRTLWAKAVEAGTAMILTARYGRAAVLAQYLRLAPYGENSHGIAHAAEWYFNKTAADLDWSEATTLAAIPQAPGRMGLHAAPGRAFARARPVLASIAEADARPVLPRPSPRRPDLLLALRLSRENPPGGIQRSTISLPLQATLRRLAVRHLAGWRAAGAQQVAVMLVERGTRNVLAAVGSAGPNSRPGGMIDYAGAMRSPGSTLKPFLYALGLDRGTITPQEVLSDRAGDAPGIANADRDFMGALLPRQALANSRNVPAAVLLRRVGVEVGYDFLRRLGLHDGVGQAGRYGLALAIGALPTTLERLMRAYATLAEDGMDAPLHWFAAPSVPERAIGTAAARSVAGFLSDPLARLPAFPRYGASEFPFAVALKTGTSQGYRDAWTLAWSDRFVLGVWLGRADAGPMSQLSGARSAGLLAQAILLRLHGAGRADLVAGGFAAPPGQLPSLLCTATGLPAGPDCPQSLAEWVAPTPAAAPPRPGLRLAIVQPGPDTHVWRNPELPPALSRLVLRAAVDPSVTQVVWLVDGQPAATAAPDQPFLWPMVPGRHHFQLRLPLAPGLSRAVAVVVE